MKCTKGIEGMTGVKCIQGFRVLRVSRMLRKLGVPAFLVFRVLMALKDVKGSRV